MKIGIGYSCILHFTPGLLSCFDRQAVSSEYIQLPIQGASAEERVHSPIHMGYWTQAYQTLRQFYQVFIENEVAPPDYEREQLHKYLQGHLEVHIFSGLFGLPGSAVDKRTRDNLYICTKY